MTEGMAADALVTEFCRRCVNSNSREANANSLSCSALDNSSIFRASSLLLEVAADDLLPSVDASLALSLSKHCI